MYYNLIKYPRAKFSALGAFGLVSSIGNAFLQDYQNRKNREFQREMLQEQQIFQRELNSQSAGMQKQSLMRAGLSPNLMTGAPPYGSASALGDSSPQQAPQIDVGGINAFAQMIQQQPLLEAQARKDNAEAKAIEIDNARKSSEDAMLYNLDILSNIKESENDNESGNVLEIPELKIAPFNAGTLKALRDYNLFHGEQSEVEKNVAKNTLEKLVADGMVKDNEVISSLVRLPVPTFNKIFNEVLFVAQQTNTLKSQEDLNISQTSLNQLEEEITRNSNIHELITKYLGNGAVADAVHALVMLVGVFTGNMRLGANISKFSGRTRSTNTNTNTNSNTNRSTSTSRVHVYKHEE